jgi:hypothetical protein
MTGQQTGTSAHVRVPTVPAEDEGEYRFDEELGRQMARDAQRVSEGDLSEAAFYEKYHQDVLEEFGRDDRPIDGGEC